MLVVLVIAILGPESSADLSEMLKDESSYHFLRAKGSMGLVTVMPYVQRPGNFKLSV